MADKNNDPAHLETEATLKRMEAKIAKEYKQATEEMQDKIDDYWSRYKLKDQKWQEWVADGKKTADQYRKWQQQQLMVGKSWESLKDSLAQDMHNANVIAKEIAQGYQPEIFANNFNYGMYEVETSAKVRIDNFTLYDRNTVNRLLSDDPDFIPPMGKKAKDNIAKGLDIPWNKQQVQSAMVQGILQGESIPQLSKRIATTVGEKNYKSAIRNARTMTTGVQNAGRIESYKRAEEMGIDMEVEWRATLDNRTRHEHRQLDGQRQPVGQPFEVHGIKIEYAGDPHAPASMIYNCRCTLRGIVSGLEPRARKYRDDSMIDGMSYNEWKAQKKSKSNPITLQEEKGEAIARKYRREYAGGGSGKKSTNRIPQPVNETKQQTNAFNIPKHSEAFVPAKTSQEAEEYAKQFVRGGFNLTGKSISYKNMDVEVANKVNERLAVIYENFNIDKLSSIEAFGKGNKKVYEQNKDAPFFTSNFGNLGINSTIVKDSKTIEKYISDGNKDFEFVMNNMDKLSGKQLELAKTYQKAGRTLVGNSVEDMVTHEIGHHISYMQSVNKELAELQKTDWKQYASELSGYANHSFGEYVAESFNAYFNGEHDKLQPELISIFDKLRK